MSEENVQELEHQDKKSFLDYTRGIRATWTLIQWLGEAFVSRRAFKYMTRMWIWVMVAHAVGLLYPWFMGLAIEELAHGTQGSFRFRVWGMCGLMAWATLMHWRRWHNVEMMIVENFRTLDRESLAMFLRKSLGLHLQEDSKLSYGNMEKGYNRIDKIQSSLLFVAIDAFVSLVLISIMMLVVSPVTFAIMGGVSLWSMHSFRLCSIIA